MDAKDAMTQFAESLKRLRESLDKLKLICDIDAAVRRGELSKVEAIRLLDRLGEEEN